MVRHLIPIVAVLLLGGCVTQYQGDEKSPYFVVPVGSTVKLNQELAIPADEVGVYFQGGKVTPKVQLDLYRPHCRLEVRERLVHAQVVKPDTFRVARATQELLHSVQLPVLLAAKGSMWAGRRGLYASDSPGPELYATRLSLRSATQPHVLYLTCGHLEGEPVQARHLTIEEIRRALGHIFTLQLAG